MWRAPGREWPNRCLMQLCREVIENSRMSTHIEYLVYFACPFTGHTLSTYLLAGKRWISLVFRRGITDTHVHVQSFVAEPI